jgi:hypothetical protein
MHESANRRGEGMRLQFKSEIDFAEYSASH